MKNTENKFWKNGISKRGKDFYSISLSIRNKAVLICFSFSLKYFNIQLFNLTK